MSVRSEAALLFCVDTQEDLDHFTSPTVCRLSVRNLCVVMFLREDFVVLNQNSSNVHLDQITRMNGVFFLTFPLELENVTKSQHPGLNMELSRSC